MPALAGHWTVWAPGSARHAELFLGQNVGRLLFSMSDESREEPGSRVLSSYTGYC